MASYAPERMEASVAMMPTFLFFVTSSARRQVGSTTPTIGRSFSACKVSSEVVDTVPQAMTMAFRSKERRNRTSCRAYFSRVSLERPPYGTRAVSPK